MFNLFSFIFFIIAMLSVNRGIEWFAVFIFASVGFAIAASIGDLFYNLNKLLNCTIIKKETLDGSTEIKLVKVENKNNN